jgi:hypothetical protein
VAWSWPEIAVVFAYGYVIVLSLLAMRQHERAARLPHHPFHDTHGPVRHVIELNTHQWVATALVASLGVRLAQLGDTGPTWLIATFTVVAVLVTVVPAFTVLGMGLEDLRGWLRLRDRWKTRVLVASAITILVDQVDRIVQLF